MVEIRAVPLPKINANDQMGTIVEWYRSVDEPVKKGELICSVETAKSIFDVEAPFDGYLVPVAQAGDQAEIGATIAMIADQPLAGQDIALLLVEEQSEPVSPSELEENGQEAAGVTYKAQILAKRHGVNLAELSTSGKKITEEDVMHWVEIRKNGKPRKEETADIVDGSYPAGRTQRILIIGGGDGAVQVLDVLAKTPNQRAMGIVDDNQSIQGRTVAGVPVVGGIDLDRIVAEYEAGEFDAAVISISTLIKLREEIFEKLKARGVRFANVIHPSAVIGTNVELGEGNVIMAFCHIGACATLGDNNFLSVYCSIEHHNTLGNHCSFGPGVVTSSRVKFGDRVRCGTGIFIEPKITIGADAVIGSGCIIWNDVPERSVLKTKLNYVERRRT